MSTRTPVVVGGPGNFWPFDPKDGFDLTHPSRPDSPLIYPRVNIQTATNTPITIFPSKSALIIIDMQIFFLSSALGRQKGEGHAAEEALLKYAIPAAREAGIQIVWLNWGISELELETVPPTTWRSFGFDIDPSIEFEPRDGQGATAAITREKPRTNRGLGNSLGDVKLEDGTIVDAGRLLMRDQWNTALHSPMDAAFREGPKAALPDVRIHKNRISGTWGGSTASTEFLEARGFRTLFFTGVNTDQYVLSTLQDANCKGWDTVLLKDGCGTTSPAFATQLAEFNCRKLWGSFRAVKSF